MKETDISIRKLIADDFYDALYLFNSVFGRNESREFWENKHRKNPLGESVFFGGYDNDRLVAMSGFMRMEYTDGNRIYRALQACESAVDITYRKRGLFTCVLRAAEDWARDNQIDFFMAMPNPNSRPGFLKQGWHEIGHAHSWGMINDLSKWVKCADRRPIANLYLLLNYVKNLFRNVKTSDLAIRIISAEEFVDGMKDLLGLRFSYTPDIVRWKLGSDGKIYSIDVMGDTIAIVAVVSGSIKYIDIKKKDYELYLGEAVKKTLKDLPLIELVTDGRFASAYVMKKAGFVTRRETPHVRVAKGLSDVAVAPGFFDNFPMQELEED